VSFNEACCPRDRLHAGPSRGVKVRRLLLDNVDRIVLLLTVVSFTGEEPLLSQLLDDRGRHIAESLTLCYIDALPNECRQVEPGDNFQPDAKRTWRVEGETHGPYVHGPEETFDESAPRIPRKARLAASGARHFVARLYDVSSSLSEPSVVWNSTAAAVRHVATGNYFLFLESPEGEPPEGREGRLLALTPGASITVGFEPRDDAVILLRALIGHGQVASAPALPVAKAGVLLSVFDSRNTGDREAEWRELDRSSSDSTGLALLRGPAAVLLRADVDHEDFVPRRVAAVARSRGFLFREVLLERAGTIRATATVEGEPDGGVKCHLVPPREGGLVDLREEPRWLKSAEANALGVCQLERVPPGPQRVLLESTNGLRSEATLEVLPGTVHSVAVELTGVRLEGRISVLGEGVEGAHLVAVQVDESSPDLAFTSNVAAGVSELDGEYSLMLGSVGEYLVSVSLSGVSVGQHRRVFLSAPEETVDFDLRGSLVHGRTIDREGSVVDDAIVRLKGPTQRRAMRSGQDGTYGFLLTESGEHRITAFKRGYTDTTETIWLPAEGVRERKDLVLEGLGGLRGRVLNNAGEGVPGASLTVFAEDLNRRPLLLDEGVTDASGEFSLSVPGARSRLYVGGVNCALDATWVEVDAEDHEVVCVPGSSITTVSLLNADSGEPIRGAGLFFVRDGVVFPPRVIQRHLEAFGLSPLSDSSGFVALPNLRPGNYTFYLVQTSVATAEEGMLLRPERSFDAWLGPGAQELEVRIAVSE
jgi:hypothetical protein